jgi:predicted nucleic acid-binding protein
VIFVDANVFLRYLVQPLTAFDIQMASRATMLLARAERNDIAVTTSEATIAEVVYIMSAPMHYNSARSTVCAGLRPLLSMRAFRLTTKVICLRALELWELHPKLSFPDALAAAYSELDNHELATFDRDLAALPMVKPIQW